MITAEEALKAIQGRFGAHAGRRGLHSKGLICAGTFTATPEGAALTRAAHMGGGEVPVVARLSNGGGDPGIPDYAPDVRGLAVSFEAPGAGATDILAQTAPYFPFADPDQFISFLRISKPGVGAVARLPLFLLRHPKVLRTLRANAAALAAPASFASRSYYAVHAFRWVDGDGNGAWVRYSWRPTVDEPDLSRGEARSRGRDYLHEEIRERIARGPVRFELELQLAGDGDNPHDPSSYWPEHRERVRAGTLELTAVSETGDERVFDPMRLIEGIEPSDDPVLHYRPSVYSASHEARTGAG